MDKNRGGVKMVSSSPSERTKKICLRFFFVFRTFISNGIGSNYFEFLPPLLLPLLLMVLMSLLLLLLMLLLLY